MVATESKNKISDGWKLTTLGKECRIRTGKKDVNEGNPEGLYPFFTCSRDFTFSDSYSFDTEALLIAGNGDVGNLHYYKGRFEAYQRTYVLDNFKTSIFYIYQFLGAKLVPSLMIEKVGTSIPYIKLNNLVNFEIPLPENIKEQQKIAEVLTTIDEAIEKTDAIIEKSKRIKQGLMQDLFRYGIDEHGNIRSEKTHKFKTVKIGNEEMRIPEEWEINDLDNFFNVIDPHPSHRAPSVVLDGVPFIGIGDISEDGYILEGARKFSFKIIREQRSRFVIETGDLGFGRVATIGKIIKFNRTNNDFCISPTMAILKPFGVDKSFAFHYLDSNIMKSQIKNLLTGSTRSSLGIELLRKIQIIILKEYEQKKIGETFDSIDVVIKSEKINKQKLLSLKRGLMEDLLTGKVRVNSLIIN